MTEPASSSFVLGIILTPLTCFLSISNNKIHFQGTVIPFAVNSYFKRALVSEPVSYSSALTGPVRREKRFKDFL